MKTYKYFVSLTTIAAIATMFLMIVSGSAQAIRFTIADAVQANSSLSAYPPILNFDLTQGSGTTVVDSANGIVGTTHGTLWSTDPSGAPVLYFDNPIVYWFGDGDYFEIPYHDALNSPTMSIEAVVYPMSSGYYTSIAERIRDGGTYQWITYLGLASTGYHSGEKPNFGLQIGGERKTIVSDIDIPLNEWSHIVGTYDGNNMRLYVNGIIVAELLDAGGPRDTGSNPFYLGHAPTSNHYFNGYYSAFRLYDRALTAEEIALGFAPIADANGPYLGANNTEIGFDGTTSSDPNGDALVYNWDWGDTTSSSDAGATPTHAYGAAGIYDVCLTVNDPSGLANTTCTYAVVYDPSGGFVTGGGWIDSPAGAYYPSDLPMFDGSYFEMVESVEPINWFEARNLAKGLTHAGCAEAHLATITSQEEYEKVLELFDEYPSGWLGGYQEEGVYPADIGWQWVTGEPFAFEAWLPGEPNDSPFGVYGEAAEQQLEMYPTGWNDVPGNSERYSFVVEHENCDPTGKATFGFVSKYKKGATVPTGNTEFQFKAGNLNFHSTSYDWLVVTGSNYAKFKGTGTINGEGEYKFMIWAGDNDPDTFHIKIWYEEGGSEVVVYDNGMDQELGGGSIVIHKAK